MIVVPPAALPGANAVDQLLSNAEVDLVTRLHGRGLSADAIATAIQVGRVVGRQAAMDGGLNIDSAQTPEQPPQYDLIE